MNRSDNIYKEFTLGISPCPNDTFIFDALVNKKIDTEGFHFKVWHEDVQTLNQWAIEGKLDFLKISYGTLPLVVKDYALLNSGSALGKGVGPLLISKEGVNLSRKEIDDAVIAIPGENTTANFLFSYAFPEAYKKIYMCFDKIEDFVLQGKGLGVIIHENRFTYKLKNLYQQLDLGDYWEKEIGCPIPLGGIVINRTYDTNTQKKIDTLIRKSLEYAWQQYPVLSEYIRSHAQEMQEDIMRKHINLYVNNYTQHLGEDGRKAVLNLINILNKQKLQASDIFLEL